MERTGQPSNQAPLWGFFRTLLDDRANDAPEEVDDTDDEQGRKDVLQGPKEHLDTVGSKTVEKRSNRRRSNWGHVLCVIDIGL